jgi:hypothetical protein
VGEACGREQAPEIRNGASQHRTKEHQALRGLIEGAGVFCFVWNDLPFSSYD